MNIRFSQATTADAKLISDMVLALTEEITSRSNLPLFNISGKETEQRFTQLLNAGHYHTCLCYVDDCPVGMVTYTETHALYAGGAIGLIQEFYVEPEARSLGIGSLMVDHIRTLGQQNDWSCIELCTPPLPEFEDTLNFYQRNGLTPVGGRKMRQSLDTL